MKEVEILSYKEGRVRMKANRAFHRDITKLLKEKIEGINIESNLNTQSITVKGLHSLEELTSLLKTQNFRVINNHNKINLLNIAQLMLNASGGLEGIAFNVAKDILLEKTGFGVVSYFI